MTENAGNPPSTGRDELYDALAADIMRRDAARKEACARGHHTHTLRYVGSWGGVAHWWCPSCNRIIEADEFVVTI